MPLKPRMIPFDPGYEPTLPNLIRASARERGERTFLVTGASRLTFAEVERHSAELARGLLAVGLGKGTRVGILMPNCAEWVLAYFAAARIGALTVAMSTFYQPPEIDWCTRFNDIDTLIVRAEYLSHDYVARLEEALPGLAEHRSPELCLPGHPYLRRIVVCGACDRPWAIRGLDALREAARGKPRFDEAFLAAIEANVSPADLLLTICTSGTSAEPKAVVHTHGTALRTVHMLCHFYRLTPEDRIWSGHAFFWIGGHNSVIIPALMIGCSTYFTATPKADEVVDLIEREGITVLNLWPSQAEGVTTRAQAVGAPLATVRRGLSPRKDEFGVPIPREQATMPMGMTETFGMHSIEKYYTPAPPGKAGNWGRHLPGVERLVADPETWRPVDPGAVGELFVRGATLMDGYYKRERHEVFTREGFFPTSDLVSIDEDDFLFFHGRATEMIKTSGANVSPREVERVLQTYPGVREPIVLGLPDPVKGEVVVAVIVANEGEVLDAGELTARLKRDISAYKVPQRIVFMNGDEIPRTGTEKPRKRDLARLLEERS